MANGFGSNPMFAGQMACPTCGFGPSMGYPMGMSYPMYGGFPYGGYASFTGMGSQYGMGGGMGMGSPYGMGFPFGFQPSYGPFFGGPMTWGGTFPGYGYGGGMYGGGPYPGGWSYTESWPSDEEIEGLVYDSIDADPVIPYESDINVDVTGGVVTLSGTVPNKRIKHAVGDDAWWVPGVWDVNNNLQVTGRRERARQMGGKTETTTSKQPTKKS